MKPIKEDGNAIAYDFGGFGGTPGVMLKVTTRVIFADKHIALMRVIYERTGAATTMQHFMIPLHV